ncbi:MAG TPA: hypothetical protein VIY08_00825 [Candidatus Nitrosocosmicus sp.]
MFKCHICEKKIEKERYETFHNNETIITCGETCFNKIKKHKCATKYCKILRRCVLCKKKFPKFSVRAVRQYVYYCEKCYDNRKKTKIKIKNKSIYDYM